MLRVRGRLSWVRGHPHLAPGTRDEQAGMSQHTPGRHRRVPAIESVPGRAAASVIPAAVQAPRNHVEMAATPTSNLLRVIWPSRAGFGSRVNPLQKSNRTGARVLEG